jgi:hypothetical protein
LTGYLLASLCADVAHTIFLLWRYVGLLRPRSKNDIR